MGFDEHHSKENDVRFMKEALRQARKGLGRTSPNPAVGAVIVRNGMVIGRGYHKKAGNPHAEIEALNKVKKIMPGDTLYVTLEPCNHRGRTPPCTDAILRSGLKRVVVGMKDPNPDVVGGGCDFLEGNGIQVTCGVLEERCRKLNEAFIKFIISKRPFVILKSALTIDGWSATSTGHSKWITNDMSRRFVHRLRDRVDAVMVGAGTVSADNPMLTTRLGRNRGRDPMRIVVDTNLRIPPDATVLNHKSPADTIIAVGSDVPADAARKVEKKGVSVLFCPTRDGRIDLNRLMGILGNMSITSIMVEGGASLAGSMLREKLVDKFFVFKAPKILGGGDGVPMAEGKGPVLMDHCLKLRDLSVRRFIDDVLIEGYPDY